jgi:hypothetical protein
MIVYIWKWVKHKWWIFFVCFYIHKLKEISPALPLQPFYNLIYKYILKEKGVGREFIWSSLYTVLWEGWGF